MTVADRRAYQNAYYRTYRKTHRASYLLSQQKWLAKKPWMLTYGGIKDRCRNPRNPSYAYYGGRGIECRLTAHDVELLWHRDGAAVMERASIDRIDLNGHYTVQNCRFIEHRVNVGRTRRTRVLT